MQNEITPRRLGKENSLITILQKIKEVHNISTSKEFNLSANDNALADPAFGQGGVQKFLPRFCRHSEAKSGE